MRVCVTPPQSPADSDLPVNCEVESFNLNFKLRSLALPVAIELPLFKFAFKFVCVCHVRFVRTASEPARASGTGRPSAADSRRPSPGRVRVAGA